MAWGKNSGYQQLATQLSESYSAGWQTPNIERRKPIEFEDTKLYERWERRVKRGKPNDFIIAISASSKTGVSGTGKTTLGTTIAEEFDLCDGGFDAKDNGTVSVSEFAYQIVPTAKVGASLYIEEAQGTPAETALNKMRANKTETLDALNGILANRNNRNTIVLVVQQLSYLVSDILPLLDAWILIRREPDEPDGPLATYYEIHGDDFQLRSDELKTPGVEDLTWDALSDGHGNYNILEEKKERAKSKSNDEEEEEDKELPKEQQYEIAREYRKLGYSWARIEDEVEPITYSRETLRLNVDDPDEEVGDDD